MPHRSTEPVKSENADLDRVLEERKPAVRAASYRLQEIVGIENPAYRRQIKSLDEQPKKDVGSWDFASKEVDGEGESWQPAAPPETEWKIEDHPEWGWAVDGEDNGVMGGDGIVWNGGYDDLPDNLTVDEEDQTVEDAAAYDAIRKFWSSQSEQNHISSDYAGSVHSTAHLYAFNVSDRPVYNDALNGDAETFADDEVQTHVPGATSWDTLPAGEVFNPNAVPEISVRGAHLNGAKSWSSLPVCEIYDADGRKREREESKPPPQMRKRRSVGR